MPDTTVKILCVHGLGDHRNSTWMEDWSQAIEDAFPSVDVSLHIKFVTYDPIFENTEIDAWEATEALAKLAMSGVGAIGRRRFIGPLASKISKKIKWTAGYVVAWLEDETFQAKTRELLHEAVLDFEPDIILAHSLGSLVTYNAFTHHEMVQDEAFRTALQTCHYVTFGSQLANPFVIGNLTSGRITVPGVQAWSHLYNEHDDVFTAPISLPEMPEFAQVLTPFDLDGVGDHNASEYIAHVNAVEEFWRPYAEGMLDTAPFGPARRGFMAMAEPGVDMAPPRWQREPDRRALLIGINDYPNESDRLEGCVNDTFLMSSVLQECGFLADQIRVCLDHRATTEGILDRLEWLLDDPQPYDERVFYFSGHGVRIPFYGERMEPDHYQEALVPWDFDWSPEHSITDTMIADLYTQLPYDFRLAMIFDCCHSGGIHRQGGAKIRSILPPDDIRHRSLKWDVETEMWVARDFERLNDRFANRERDVAAYFGKDGATVRLGRASLYRKTAYRDYLRLRREMGDQPIGPYLPMILQACQEDEYAYEYRHGVTSYGAFSYSLASILRRLGPAHSLTFQELLEETRYQLTDLGYDQEPQILGPRVILDAEIPWLR